MPPADSRGSIKPVIGFLVQRSAKRWPNRPAIVDEDGTVSFGQLSNRVFRLANALTGLGLEPGDRILDVQVGSRTYVESDLACAVAGLLRVPVDPRLSAAEIADIGNDAGAAAVVAGPEFAELGERLRDEVESIRHIVGIRHAAAGTHDYEQLLRSASASTAWRSRATSGLISIDYSAGTTGAPRGCMRTVRARIASASAALTSITGTLGPQDVFLHPGPTGRAADVFTLPYLVSGARQVLQRDFDAEHVAQMVRAHGVTCTALGPTMLEQLVDALAGPRQPREPLASLRTIAYTGAPIAPDRIEHFDTVVSHRLVQFYGTAEAISPLSVLTAADHREPGLLGSAGLPVPSVAMRVDADHGGDVGVGETGELMVGGDHVMRGYWSNKAAASGSIRHGWVRTGDMATVDERGYVYVLDRLADVIISGGLSILPREVEAVLDGHPSVREASVVGVLDRERGERVVAFVATTGEPARVEEQLRRVCADRLPAHKAPGRYEFVEQLPRSAAGKVSRKTLRARAAQAATGTR
jgi:acyl-CoA synthetase (AMP-forming)/AMP-acid ligase II